MGASWSSLLDGRAGIGRITSMVPRSPLRSLTRKLGGTTNCRRHLRWLAREGDFLFRRLLRRSPERAMRCRIVHERCAGLDVHKKSVYACAIWPSEKGDKKQEIRRFGTFTADLLKLADWLREHGITDVTMEATGVFWRPVWALLEGRFELLLVNRNTSRRFPDARQTPEIASGLRICSSMGCCEAVLSRLPRSRTCAT